VVRRHSNAIVKTLRSKSRSLNDIQIQLDALLTEVRRLRARIAQGMGRAYPHPFEQRLAHDRRATR
jgi:hypothetical protein